MLAVCEHERAVVRVGNYIVFACREVLAAGVFAGLFPLGLFDRGSGGVDFAGLLCAVRNLFDGIGSGLFLLGLGRLFGRGLGAFIGDCIDCRAALGGGSCVVSVLLRLAAAEEEHYCAHNERNGGDKFSFHCLFLSFFDFLFSFPEKTLRDNSVRSISN